MSIYLPIITYAGLPWALCRARKEASCTVTGRLIKPGDSVYRPITNGSERMRRIKAGRSHLDVTKNTIGGDE